MSKTSKIRRLKKQLAQLKNTKEEVVYIKGTHLNWRNLIIDLKLKATDYRANNGTFFTKWSITRDTDPEIVKFLNSFGYNNAPYGLTNAQVAMLLLNEGFAKHLTFTLPSLAIELKIARINEDLT